MPIDLYSFSKSAPCRAVAMTARQVGVELNVKEINWLDGDHMTPEFLAINPQHTVPTIDDNGLYLNESRAICTYLVNQYAKDDSLYPKEPKIRAVVDQRLYFDMIIHQRFGKVYYPVMLQGATTIDKKAQEDFAEIINFLELFLSNTTYVACDHLTVADIALMASMSTIEAVDKKLLEDHTKIKSWMERCKVEIADYEETNGNGAKDFGHWAHSALSKLV